MAKQSNPFQRLIRKIYEYVNQSGGTVTESALVEDTQGNKREIDILIESEICGEPLRIAIECRAHKRKGDNTWIDALCGKYASLRHEIHKVIAVSQSGFFKNAADRARLAGIDTRTLKEAETTNWADEFKRFGMVQIRRRDDICRVRFHFKESPEEDLRGSVQADLSDLRIADNTVVRMANGEESTVGDLKGFLYDNALKGKLSALFTERMKDLYPTLDAITKQEIQSVHVGPIPMPPGLCLCLAEDVVLPIDSLEMLVTCEFKYRPVPVQHRMFGRALISQADFTSHNTRVAVIQSPEKPGKAHVTFDVITPPREAS